VNPVPDAPDLARESEPPVARVGDSSSGPPHSAEELALFRRYRATRDRALRNELVERNLALIEPHIRRFTGRGLAPEDLRQVAFLGLIGAVERFDPERGVAFATFAGRTVEGELKRFLRDRSWALRPPRRQQELFLHVRQAEDALVHRLGRSPTVGEIAAEVDESEDRVLEALEAGGARRAGTLDRPAGDTAPEVHPALGRTETDYRRVEMRLIVEQLLSSLDDRQRTVIELRFFHDLGQPEIAERLGLSQSYVSRLIRRILAEMRAELSPAEIDDVGPLAIDDA